MTTARLKSSEKSSLTLVKFKQEEPILEQQPSSLKEQRLREERRQEKLCEEERMKEVLLLIEGLARREKVAIKMIADRLYDVAKVNFVNKKISSRPLNKTLKAILGLPKPIAVQVAFMWFASNCPELITNWLQRKVNFKK